MVFVIDSAVLEYYQASSSRYAFAVVYVADLWVLARCTHRQLRVADTSDHAREMYHPD